MRLNDSDDFYYNRPLQGAQVCIYNNREFLLQKSVYICFMSQLQFSDAYDFPDAPSGSFSMQIISPNVQVNCCYFYLGVTENFYYRSACTY